MKKGKIVLNFTDFGNRKWKDKLSGGNADDKTPEDFNSDDVAIGTAVEREHTSNPDIATEIAIDHLSQSSTYYDQLITSGIADEQGAIDLYDELKDDSDREKAKHDILDSMDIGSENEGDKLLDPEEFEDELDMEEDELGSDKADIDENDEIINDVYPKNIQEKIKITKMEKVKNYNSFIKEDVNQPTNDVNQPGPERKFSKENKYKFQMPYDKKVVDKLNDYSFEFYAPEGEEVGDKKFIIIDILNLNYTIIGKENPEIRSIDSSKLKHILENL